MQNDDRPFYAKERPQTPEMTAVRLMRLTIRVRWVMMIMSRRIIALRPVTMTIILIMIMVIMVVIALLLNAAAAADDDEDNSDDDRRKNALRLTMMRLIALRQAG